MKGTIWNGDATITKGCGSSRGEEYFSVGNLVAFLVSEYSSPDGRQFSHGCIPTHGGYLLQEEIPLEEYNNSTFPGEPGVGPVGGMDRREIVEIPDDFWHWHCRPGVERTFLLGVLDTSENVFLKGFIHGDIAEVRNHPGKFLHIYEIPRGYRKCKSETFADTVSAINLQKEQEDEGTEIISRAEAGEVVDPQKLKEAHIRASQWVVSAGEYLSLAETAGLDIAIAVAEANDHPEKLATLQSWKDAGVTNGDLGSLDCVKSSYDYNHHYYVKRSGWREGVQIAAESYGLECVRTLSLCSLSPERLQQHITAEGEAERLRKEARKAEFDEISKTVTEKYGEEIFKIALKKKGQVLAVLTTLANSQSELEFADIKKILQVAGSSAEISNLISIVSAEILPGQAEKVAKKAYAWAYLYDAFPSVAFSGYFDDARSALEKYSKIWEPKVSKATFSLGDFDSLRELREKLA